MKIYVVVRYWYNDGEYEDYYEGENEYCGVYPSVERAKTAISQMIEGQGWVKAYLCGDVFRRELDGDFGKCWELPSNTIYEASVRFYDEYDDCFTEHYYILETEVEEL